MQILIVDQGANPVPKKLTKDHLQKIKAIDPEAKITIVEQKSVEMQKKGKTAEVVIGMANDVKDLAQFPQLKWLHITSAGANNLSLDIVDSEIVVTNSSGVHPIPISEHVLGMMLMLVRGLQKAVWIQATKGEWVRDMNVYQPDELAGKKLLVVGMGRIGERVAKLGEAFDMQVVGVVRNPDNHKGSIKVVSVKDLDKELKDSDFVINCLPLTEETRGMFDAKRLAKFKKGSFFINIGRGESVVEKDLVEALKSGHLKGAGLDVFEQEPTPKTNPLWKMDNVIMTPHYSGANPHYFDRVIDIFCDNLKAFLKNKPLPNLVNKQLGY